MHFHNGQWAAAAFAFGVAVDGIALAAPATQPSVSATEPTINVVNIPTPAPLPIVNSAPTTQPPLVEPAATPPPAAAGAPTTQPAGQIAASSLAKVVVTSNLDDARDEIAPGLGASSYTIGPSQIQTIPQGQDAPFQQVAVRMPSVVMDSFGAFHVRGEHADVAYRINGIILPDPLTGFSQPLDTHLVDSVTLIDGSLPAEFGFRTAGVFDIDTKSGESLQGGEISMYGGTYDTYEPAFEFGGSSGKWDYFASGSYRSDDLGIENPTPNRSAIHDETEQARFFGYAAYNIDDTSRLMFLLSSDYGNFQIPDTPGLPQVYALAGEPNYPSQLVNENQNEQQYYGAISYQKSEGPLSLQVSAFYSWEQIHYIPDPIGDLIYNGVASEIYNNFATAGFQADLSYVINDQHTLRFGGIANYTIERNDTNTAAFPVDPITGLQSSDVPETIVDDTKNDATSAGVYLQDEWKLTPTFTVNYGLRYDTFNASFDNEAQLSPRVNFIWKATKKTTFHFGYSRYFDPPPIQYVPPSTLAKFANTTNAPPNFIDDPPKVERSNYFDVGVTQQITQPWSVNLDGFYKRAKNLVDLGQFGSALIYSPFNYADGYVWGSEISTNYTEGRVSMYGNFAWVLTGGKNIDSQQFLIDNAELAYIQDNYIHLDHQSEYTASVGASYKITDIDMAYIDLLYGNGLRDGFANTEKTPAYYPVNVGYQHVFRLDGSSRQLVRFRIDVINVFDQVYLIRSGTGVGVFAPQYGQRRTFLAGLSYEF